MSNINNKDNSGENARGPSSGGAAGAPAASSGGSGGAVAIAAKKVCFICGSYTSQTINIFEPRDGPNIIELINEKFKVPPQSEDKFLCYSCNNWLINWHTTNQQQQAKNSADDQKSAAAGDDDTNGGDGDLDYPDDCRPYIDYNPVGSRSLKATQTASNPPTVEVRKLLVPRPPAFYALDPYFAGCVQSMELRHRLSGLISKRTVQLPPAMPHMVAEPEAAAAAAVRTIVVRPTAAATVQPTATTTPQQTVVVRVSATVPAAAVNVLAKPQRPEENHQLETESRPPPPPYQEAVLRLSQQKSTQPASENVAGSRKRHSHETDTKASAATTNINDKRRRISSSSSSSISTISSGTVRRPKHIVSPLHARRQQRALQISTQRRQRANPQAALNECDQCGRRLHALIGHARTHRELFLSQRLVRMCQPCRRAMHKLHFGGAAQTHNMQQTTSSNTCVMELEPLAQAPVGATTVVGGPLSDTMVRRLMRLGTSIVLEEQSDAADVDKQHEQASEYLQRTSPLLFSTLTQPTRNQTTTTKQQLKTADAAADECGNSRLMRTYRRMQEYYVRSNQLQQQQGNSDENDEECEIIDDDADYASDETTTANTTVGNAAAAAAAQRNEIRSTNMHRNERNEIVLAFDRTLTEVFPVADRHWLASASDDDRNHQDNVDSGCSSADDDSNSATMSTVASDDNGAQQQQQQQQKRQRRQRQLSTITITSSDDDDDEEAADVDDTETTVVCVSLLPVKRKRRQQPADNQHTGADAAAGGAATPTMIDEESIRSALSIKNWLA